VIQDRHDGIQNEFTFRTAIGMGTFIHAAFDSVSGDESQKEFVGAFFCNVEFVNV
jgi:hypothetical protein